MTNHAEQYMPALERANQVRLARARLKRRIAGGEVTVGAVLRNTPPEAVSWAIGDLLINQRRWGRTRTLTLLHRLRIHETKTVGALTGHQRDQIIVALGQDPER